MPPLSRLALSLALLVTGTGSSIFDWSGHNDFSNWWRPRSLAAQDQSAALPAVETHGVRQTPFSVGDRYFFVSGNGGLYVKDGRNGRSRQLLAPKSFTTLVPSENGEYLAYGVPSPDAKVTANGEQVSYEVRVRDVAKGRDLDTLHNANISWGAWTRNNKGFFYVREGPGDSRQRIYYHSVKHAQADDPIIYSRPDEPDWRYDIRVSDDGQYAVITISHPIDDNTRMYFIDLDNPKKPTFNAPIVKLVDQFSAKYTFVDNGGYYFFLQTNREAPNGQIVLANTNIIRETRWQTVIPQSADTLMFARTAGDEYIIAVSRNSGKVTARVYSPPDPREIQDEMRRRADSVRRNGGDRGGARASDRDRGQGDEMRRIPMETSILRLNLTRELPVPEGGEIVDMISIADQAELFYTVRFADGSTRAYFYNVKNRQSGFFDTMVSGQ